MFYKTLKKGLCYSIIERNRRLVGRWNMLEKIIELTNEYIESMPKKERKKYGQFFTSMETVSYTHLDVYKRQDLFTWRIL